MGLVRGAWCLGLAVVVGAGCGNGGEPVPDVRSVADASDARTDGADDVAPDAPAFDSGMVARTFTPVPRSRVVEPGVRLEVFTVDAPAPPANPANNTATPAELNRVQVARFRADTTPVTPARAVVIGMPGFLGGAGSFGTLARALVRRGVASGQAIEVWAVDRRSNLLEDQTGMDAAEALGDPDVAVGYYLRRNVTLNGRAFANFLEPRARAIAYMSEWGLATAVNDLRAVVALVPSASDHVVLLGHSLGASVVEAYAAWDFEGTPGYRTIAGLAVIEGVASGTTVTETVWRDTGVTGGPLPSPGVAALRDAGPYYFALPLLGVRVYAVAEVIARRAALAPDAVESDPFRDIAFRTLLGIQDIPPMSNAAALGFGFDEGSCALSFAAMSLGAPAGGAVMRQGNPFGLGGNVTVPASGTDTYRWTDAPGTTPREFTPIASGAAVWTTTPVNFAEWYFPERLPVDIAALGDLHLAADSWQAREGIRAFHGGELDVPVLAVGTAFVTAATAFDGLRARLTPQVGAGRPNAGATRDVPAGFRRIAVPGMTHIDPLSAPDGNPANPVPEAVATFATSNTAGVVTVPAR